MENNDLEQELVLARETLEQAEKAHLEEICVVNVSNENQKSMTKRLNKELSQLRQKVKEDLEDTTNKFKLEVKRWKKNLGRERKERIKLEKKLSEYNQIDDEKETAEIFTQTKSDDQILPSEFVAITDENLNTIVTSSLVSASTSNLPPITSKGFVFHSDNTIPSVQTPPCSHSTQCIRRQPRPPPLPSIVPLVNHRSQYHQKFFEGSLDWGSTCSYCMRIDYERYGCDSCVWIKCFGELHGYPDRNPYDYKKFR